MTEGRPVVAVAMSGGVDSSVAAALCVEAGYDVFGIMLRLWAEPGARTSNACCTLEAMDDAVAVAAALDIPFSVIDAGEVFEREVVSRFVDDSVAGDTPNPCLQCNRTVRFSFLLDRARALGADFLATGHYAHVSQDDEGRFQLCRGADRSRDQSYVLHVLDQAQLRHAMFPLGGLLKTEVREHARRLGLPVAERAESTDLCWVGNDGVQGFLRRRLALGGVDVSGTEAGDEDAADALSVGAPAADSPVAAVAGRGPIVDRQGRVLGEHQGLPLYTLGQRRGLGVATGRPVYVVERNFQVNSLVVGPVDELYSDRVNVRSMHWIAGVAPTLPLRCEAQIRYKAAPAAATVEESGGSVAVRFDEPQRAPTPGQAVVVYSGDMCLGGGLIERAG